MSITHGVSRLRQMAAVLLAIAVILVFAGFSAPRAEAAASGRIPTATVSFSTSVSGAGSVTIDSTDAPSESTFVIAGVTAHDGISFPAQTKDPITGISVPNIKTFNFTGANPGETVSVLWSYSGEQNVLIAQGVAPVVGSPAPVDTDGDKVIDTLDKCPGTPAGETVDANGCSASQLDGDADKVVDSIDKCPSTPSGSTVNDEGCALGLAPIVTLNGTTEAPSSTENGNASFTFTNNNEVAVTYQVRVNSVYVGDVTLAPNSSQDWSVDRPAGVYSLVLRAAGSVTNPVSFTITAKPAVVVPPTDPVETPKPVETKKPVPTEKPVETKKPVEKPAETKKPAVVVTPQLQPTKAPVVVAPVVPQETKAVAVGSGQRGGSLPQSVTGVDQSVSSVSELLIVGGMISGLLGFVLLFRSRKVAMDK